MTHAAIQILPRSVIENSRLRDSVSQKAWESLARKEHHECGNGQRRGAEPDGYRQNLGHAEPPIGVAGGWHYSAARGLPRHAEGIRICGEQCPRSAQLPHFDLYLRALLYTACFYHHWC